MNLFAAPTHAFSADVAPLAAVGHDLVQLASALVLDLGARDPEVAQHASRLALACEALGRLFVRVGFEPIGLSFGLLFLWLHKHVLGVERALLATRAS